MDMLTIPAPTQTDIMTTARRVMPGDILLDRQGVPIALVTRARTRLTGRRVTRIEGEWLLSRPLGASSVFRRTTMATTATAIRREICEDIMTTTDLQDLGFSESFIAGFFPTGTAPALPAFSQAGLASLIS